jgi:hypothetical protein
MNKISDAMDIITEKDPDFDHSIKVKRIFTIYLAVTKCLGKGSLR